MEKKDKDNKMDDPQPGPSRKRNHDVLDDTSTSSTSDTTESDTESDNALTRALKEIKKFNYKMSKNVGGKLPDTDSNSSTESYKEYKAKKKVKKMIKGKKENGEREGGDDAIGNGVPREPNGVEEDETTDEDDNKD